MTNRYKRLQKLLNCQGELTFSEINTVLNDFGYMLIRIKGSHHMFKGKYGAMINFPVHNGSVGRHYVRDIRNIINKHQDFYEKM